MLNDNQIFVEKNLLHPEEWIMFSFLPPNLMNKYLFQLQIKQDRKMQREV